MRSALGGLSAGFAACAAAGLLAAGLSLGACSSGPLGLGGAGGEGGSSATCELLSGCVTGAIDVSFDCESADATWTSTLTVDGAQGAECQLKAPEPGETGRRLAVVVGGGGQSLRLTLPEFDGAGPYLLSSDLQNGVAEMLDFYTLGAPGDPAGSFNIDTCESCSTGCSLDAVSTDGDLPLEPGAFVSYKLSIVCDGLLGTGCGGGACSGCFMSPDAIELAVTCYVQPDG